MLDTESANVFSKELHQTLQDAKTVPLISARRPDLNVEDAYAISRGILDLRLAAGERLVGKKIGLTSKVVQDMLGIDEPDYGFLTDAMRIRDGGEIPMSKGLITPMMEAEVAFVMKSSLPLEGVTPEMVLKATEYVSAGFEIVDTRFDTHKLTIVDTVADNSSSALFVLGENRVDPRELDLIGMDCTLFRNGEPLSQGKGAAVMGSPLNSIAWLANKLGSMGVGIEAGDVVLPGSLVPFAPIAAGDSFTAEFTGLGRVSCTFI